MDTLRKTEHTLQDIVDCLVAVYHPERVYLFGSKARDEAGPDSDYDILLVMPDDSPPEMLSAEAAYDALWTLKTAVDVVIWTRTGFENRLHLKASLPATVSREGQLLYAA